MADHICALCGKVTEVPDKLTPRQQVALAMFDKTWSGYSNKGDLTFDEKMNSAIDKAYEWADKFLAFDKELSNDS